MNAITKTPAVEAPFVRTSPEGSNASAPLALKVTLTRPDVMIRTNVSGHPAVGTPSVTTWTGVSDAHVLRGLSEIHWSPVQVFIIDVRPWGYIIMYVLRISHVIVYIENHHKDCLFVWLEAMYFSEN